MNNNVYLNQIKPYYNSLKYFSIQDNYLILNLNQRFILPLIHTNLSEINTDVFLSQPNEIFHFIQMNELLYKTEINEKEIAYIKEFTNRYLKLKQNSIEGKEVNNTTLWCLELLISKSFNEEFINNPASKEIANLIDEDNKKLESGLSTGMKLVLSKDGNQNYDIEEEFDYVKNFEKAGFTTIILIALTVALTCIFFANYVITH